MAAAGHADGGAAFRVAVQAIAIAVPSRGVGEVGEQRSVEDAALARRERREGRLEHELGQLEMPVARSSAH